jgi:hypothetical protein
LDFGVPSSSLHRSPVKTSALAPATLLCNFFRVRWGTLFLG